MSLLLVRLDDRLIHGQVVVGWGRALGVTRVVLVDDRVRVSDWEQELFRMGVPAEVELRFASIAEAVQAVPGWAQSAERTMLVTGDVATLVELVDGAPAIREVNLGGVHQKPGRHQILPYLFLTDTEEEQLRGLAARGVAVSAQDVPTARPIPIKDLR